MLANYSQDSPDEPTVYQTYTFYALDASTGAQRWSYSGTVSKSIDVVSADADIVYLTTSETGSSFTTLLALHAGDGAVRWQKSIPQQQIHTPVVLNNTMYLAFDREVSAVSLLDGSEIWNTSLSGQSFIGQVVNGTLYAITTSALYALEGSNSLVNWRLIAPIPGVYAVVNGVPYGSSVQVDTQQQRVQTSIFALDTSSGKQLWKYDTASAITAPVVG